MERKTAIAAKPSQELVSQHQIALYGDSCVAAASFAIAPPKFPMPRIALIVDTHNLLRPEALAFLAGSDHIVNGGGIGSTLVVTHFDKGLIGSRTSKIKLRRLGKSEDAFKRVVDLYWQRHQVMRAQQAERATAAAD